MVRRWSYVNRVNLTSFRPYKTFRCFSNDIIFKETTVFRKARLQYSVVRRKSWGRRRHSYQWSLYLRVLFDWSKDYHFFKKYASFVFKRHLHRNSFLTYNVLVHHKYSSGFYPGLEFLNSLTTPGSVTQYYYRRGSYVPYVYRFFKQSPLFQITTSKSNLNLLTKNPTLPPILFNVIDKAILPAKTLRPKDNPLTILNTVLSFNLYLAQIIALYKILVVLYKLSLN